MASNTLQSEFCPNYDLSSYLKYKPIYTEPLNSHYSNKIHIHHYHHPKKPMLVSSKFPEDFFSPIKETNHKQTINNNQQSFIEQKDLHIIKSYKIENQPEATTINSKLCIVNIDNEYDEDKELLELIEGKDRRLHNNKIQSVVEENENDAVALVQTLRQKKKQPKCEIILEVDESKFNRTKTSFFCSKQQQINEVNNDNNEDSFDKKDIKTSSMMIINRIKTPFIRLCTMKQKEKDKKKSSIEAIQKDSSLISLKNSQRDDNAINSNLQTENSSNHSNLSINRKINLGSSQSQSNGNDGHSLKETIELQKDINTILETKNNLRLNEDLVVKQKLRLIMQNISNIKTVIAQKDKRRLNLVSAPSCNSKINLHVFNDKKTQQQQLNKQIEFNMINIEDNGNDIKLKQNNKKIQIEDNNWKMGSMSHRKRQGTAPIKVISIKK